MKFRAAKLRAGILSLVLAILIPGTTLGALSFTVDPNGWPNETHRTAAVNAMQLVVNRHNAYGDFGNYNVWIYYNAGIPTAQASYLGSIGFGGTYPNERVTLHESNHYLGSGTYGHTYTGPRAVAIMEQFEGIGARLNTDGTHFWPYGMNYDNEWSEIAAQRNIAIMYALRGDWGIGSTANPAAWAATSVTLTNNDAAGESGFNYASKWSDNTFAHPNANYSTGAFSIRTPQGYPSWTFAGNSLTVNPGGRLLYNGWGTTGIVTFKNLTVNGGTVRHDQFSQDLFQLAGNVTLASTATFEAANGNIKILGELSGSGSLTKSGPYTLTLTGGSTYSGATVINAGTLRLAPPAPVASYSFANVSGTTVVNEGTGGASMNGTLNANGGSGFINTTGGPVAGLGALVLNGTGTTVDVNSGIVDLSGDGNWTVSAWIKTTQTGATIFNKGDGANWNSGYSTFYLGDGSDVGSGGLPTAVRWGGGWLSGSTAVNDGSWHQVTFTNSAGAKAVYVDGVATMLSQNQFFNPDTGSKIRIAFDPPGQNDGEQTTNGSLSGIKFFNSALSASQVAQLYSSGLVTSVLPTTTNVTIAASATLDLNGTLQQIGSLTGASGSTVALGAGRLIVSSAASTQFSGTISGVGGSFVKDGIGTLTLTSPNTYSAGSTINGGTLRVNNIFGSGTGSGPVVVNSGGTLGGTGKIAGAVTLNSGGHIAPGISIESLDVGSLTLAAGSILDFELDTISGVDISDLIVVTSDNGLTVDGGTFNLTNAGGMTAGTYTLIDYVGALQGSISNLLLGAVPAGFSYSLVNNASATSIDLIVAPQLVGDYNNDGAVDAADYAVWRANVGQPAGTLPNDNTGMAIGDAQYALWRANFGNPPSGGSAAGSAAVPEPASVIVALIGLSAAIFAPFRDRHA